jgi:diguanylate cyclase (GGDEF)-like protein
LLAHTRSIGVFGRFILEWWREPVDYSAQVEYFAKRGMSRAIQVMIGLGTGLDAVISLVILLPFAGTRTSHVAVAAFAALQLFWAWAWCCRPWPSRRMSLAFVITADLGIAAISVLDASWLLALFGFNAFAMISVYLMFFDGPRVLGSHAVWVLLTTTAFALQAAPGAHFDTMTFTASTLAAVAGIVTSPLGIQLGIWALRNDANESVTDPLTGLLNRRGLHLHIADLLRGASTPDTEVILVVVDLDRFKHVNDTYGHTIGDAVLVRSARRIMSAVRGSALVARTGGEEFVVVDVAELHEYAREDFDRIRFAIAAPAEYEVTASVGVTRVAAVSFVAPEVDPVELLDAMIDRADRAMFDAKRNGGNATIDA